jgi:alkanesulfonate monooxygenase SsuD/methylene tetrahydromethanopterin reductase-like flavin-dependent oxidoreductase (luciferase family)
MIGGGGEKQTLRIVAKYGDACNLFGGPKTVKAKLDVLKKHCSEVGRDCDEILKTALTTVVIAEDRETLEGALVGVREPGVSDDELDEIVLFGTPDEVAAKIERRIEVGIQYLIVNFIGSTSEKESLELFAEKVVPKFQL